MTKAPIFTITYSRNWDGGGQEYNSAASCVKQVFGPDATIIRNCVDAYPIRVIVSAEMQGIGKLELWSGRQQSLFRKYGEQRRKSMSDIKAILEDLKDEFDL